MLFGGMFYEARNPTTRLIGKMRQEMRCPAKGVAAT